MHQTETYIDTSTQGDRPCRTPAVSCVSQTSCFTMLLSSTHLHAQACCTSDVSTSRTAAPVLIIQPVPIIIVGKQATHIAYRPYITVSRPPSSCHKYDEPTASPHSAVLDSSTDKNMNWMPAETLLLGQNSCIGCRLLYHTHMT